MTRGIEFNEDYGESYFYEDNPRGITKIVMFFLGGVIKTRKQAEYFLIFIIIISIALSFFLLRPKEKYAAGAFPTPPVQEYDFDF